MTNTDDSLPDEIDWIRLPDSICWNVRPPTVEECELCGRDVGYAETDNTFNGDYVIETAAVPDAQAKFAEALVWFGMCGAAHIIPAGVYLEEWDI